MVGLEDPDRLAGLRLAVFEVQRVGAGYIGGRSSKDLFEEGRASGVLIDEALDQLLLSLGAMKSAHTHSSSGEVHSLAYDRCKVDVLGRLS